MALAKDYASVMGRSNDIQKDALGLDYAEFETSPIAFDYDKLMTSTDTRALWLLHQATTALQ